LVRELSVEAGATPLVLRQGVGDAQVLALAARALIKCRKSLTRRPRSAKALHDFRLRVKRCRYALEALSEAAVPGMAAKVQRCLVFLQDRLGEQRDTLLALQWVKQQAPGIGQPTARALAERLRARESRARAELGLVPA